MIKSITVTNHLGDSLEMELTRPEKSGFIVKSVDGLGPVVSTVNTTELLSTDGSVFNSARTASRNIVFNLEFYSETGAIEEVRLKSYKYFPTKEKIKMVIKTDKRMVETEGYVESNEPDIFSENESATISVICPDPYFYACGINGETTTVFSSVEPLFEFPFSNESLYVPLLEMSKVENVVEKNIVYTGESKIGMDINIHLTDYASDITLKNVNTRESMTIKTSDWTYHPWEFPTILNIVKSDDLSEFSSLPGGTIILFENMYYIITRVCGVNIYPDDEWDTMTLSERRSSFKLFQTKYGNAEEGVLFDVFDIPTWDSSIASYNTGAIVLYNGRYYLQQCRDPKEFSSYSNPKPGANITFTDPYYGTFLLWQDITDCLPHGDLEPHDDINISTKTGKKSITLTRQGKTINFLNHVTKDSSWLQLNIGNNKLSYEAVEGAENLIFTVKHKTSYKGV